MYQLQKLVQSKDGVETWRPVLTVRSEQGIDAFLANGYRLFDLDRRREVFRIQDGVAWYPPDDSSGRSIRTKR